MSTVTIDNVTYSLTTSGSGNTASVTGNTLGTLTNVIIPSTITDNGTSYTVTSIGSTAFTNSSKLASIVIPDSVTIIHDASTTSNSTSGIPGTATLGVGTGNSISYQGAFSTCIYLTSVTIGNGVTSIGSNAFISCYALSSVTIPDAVTSIGASAFDSCSALTAVTIPDSVTSIGDYAFQYCSAMTAVTIGSSVTSIGDSAFASCGDTLTRMYFLGDYPSGIDDGTFYLDNSLNLYYVDGATGWFGTVGGRTAQAITAGTSGVASITAFSNSNKTAAFSVANNSYTNVELLVLNGASGVISGTAFALSSGSWTVTSPALSHGDVVKVFLQTSSGATVTELLSYAYDSDTTYYSVDLEVGISSIGNTAFSQCYNLSSVTIPDAVTSIAANAFYQCYSLSSVTIPDAVTSIAANAFYQCYALTAVTIPDAVTSIGASAFYECYDMTAVTIGSSVTSIGANAFYSCLAMTSVTISSDNTTFLNGSNGEVYQISGSDVSLIFYPRDATSITIPTNYNNYSVTSIGESAFQSCSALTAVSIGSSVTSIGIGAFSQCYNLSSVTIPDAVTSIGYGAFVMCSNLTAVTIGSSVTSIGTSAFQNCFAMTAVTIPDSVTSIGESAFQSCSALTAVSIGSSVTSIGDSAFYSCLALTSVTIPDSVTSIGANAFYSCYALTAVTIGSSVTSIGNGAFYLCLALTSVTISSDNTTFLNDSNGEVYQISGSDVSLIFCPRDATSIAIPTNYNNYSVTSISDGAFFQCSAMTAVTIPDAVTSIGASAFFQCSAMTAVTIGSSVTSIGDSAFSSCGNTLTSMYFLGDYPSGIDNYTFYGDNSLTLYYVDGATGWSGTVEGKSAYPIPTIDSATTSSVSISADTNLSSVYVYTSTDSGVTWTTNTVTMINGSGTLSNLSAGTLVSTIANIYDATTYADYCKTVSTPSSNVCFPAKTPVLTNQGPVNIEDIDPAVHTIRNKKIVAITKTVAHDKNLVRIAKHALGRNYPEKTTFISQNHKVFFQGQMVKAKHLVDNCNITLVPYNGQVLYNVLLAEHEKMQVNNLIVETLHPEHKVAKLYRILKNVDAAHHGKIIALFNKCDKEHRNHL